MPTRSSSAEVRGARGVALASLVAAAIGMYIGSLGARLSPAKADAWIGAGQHPLSQVRDWTAPQNWLHGAVPPEGDVNVFGISGDGIVQLTANQAAGGLTFGDFAATKIVAGTAPVPPRLALRLDAAGHAPVVRTGESLRDTYGVDYFVAGPTLAVDLSLDAALTLNLGAAVQGNNSAMMISGRIDSGSSKLITYNGNGSGTSLWVTSNNAFSARGAMLVNVNPGPQPAGRYGNTLHLADSGRLDNALINLSSQFCYLGLQESGAGAAATYRNDMVSAGGTIFTDRSYQADDMAGTINHVETIDGMVTTNSAVEFGSSRESGRTNNGYAVAVATLLYNGQGIVKVANGNLTEQRAGSRYVSGANRLQEAHNYTYVGNLKSGPSAQNLRKDGSGVLVVLSANDGQGLMGSLAVDGGVLSVAENVIASGSPGVQLGPAGGVGVRWNWAVNLLAPQPPFVLQVSGSPPGQCGALEIDVWDHNQAINTNILDTTGKATYVRVGSSLGGDASFDPQPLPQ